MKTSHREDCLARITEANPSNPIGPGLDDSHFIPLCRWHNRKLASDCRLFLERHGLSIQDHRTRMYVELFAQLGQREEAFALLREFQSQHADTPPRTMSRDYDIFFLLGIIVLPMAIAAGTVYTQFFPTWTPLGILTTGVSIGVCYERLQRHYRYANGWTLSLREIVLFVSLCAANFAIWIRIYT